MIQKVKNADFVLSRRFKVLRAGPPKSSVADPDPRSGAFFNRGSGSGIRDKLDPGSYLQYVKF
jgi:hypothetical protein